MRGCPLCVQAALDGRLAPQERSLLAALLRSGSLAPLGAKHSADSFIAAAPCSAQDLGLLDEAAWRRIYCSE